MKRSAAILAALTASAALAAPASAGTVSPGKGWTCTYTEQADGSVTYECVHGKTGATSSGTIPA